MHCRDALKGRESSRVPANPETRTFAELSHRRQTGQMRWAVLVGMLRDADQTRRREKPLPGHWAQWESAQHGESLPSRHSRPS
jgi:hypothetical protein